MELEVEAIENLRDELETLMKDPERKMVHFLERQGYIRKNLSDDVLNPRSLLTKADKAGKLVDAIVEAVGRDKSLFQTLVDKFEEETYYRIMARKLREELVRLGGR